jgi:hypothetical protein
MTTAIPRLLAQAFLNGELRRAEMVARGAELLGRKWKWLGPLATRFLKEFRGAKPRLGAAARFLRYDEALCTARFELRIAKWTPSNGAPVMRWKLPELAGPADLAQWLGLSGAEVDWFADRKGLNNGKSGHYSYPLFDKPGKTARLIEAPKTRMKELLRRLLVEVFAKIPVHPAAHGFVAGRSIRTFAAPHAGQPCVLKMDLADFFPSISRARVESLLITAGYDEPVAELLAGICTNRAPRGIAPSPAYMLPHLPQGAPTSPAIANLCMFRADRRLRGLAESAGAVYTRYADDLAFSGGPNVARLAPYAAAIIEEEGFHVNHRKTRLMRRGGSQKLAGLTVNEKVNISRADFDALKALLTNCARQGPASQNRDGVADFRAHLNGRIAFVESIHSARGEKLRNIFETIDWSVRM